MLKDWLNSPQLKLDLMRTCKDLVLGKSQFVNTNKRESKNPSTRVKARKQWSMLMTSPPYDVNIQITFIIQLLN